MDEKVLNAAFIPFGDIIDIQMPLDYETRILLTVPTNLQAVDLCNLSNSVFFCYLMPVIRP